MTGKCYVAGGSEERLTQLLRLIIGVLEKHFLTCTRNLTARAPVIVLVRPQV